MYLRLGKLVRDYPFTAIVTAFAAGFSVAHFFHPLLFGYPNAETCTLHAKNRWAVGACYDLYPTLSALSERRELAERQATIDKEEPGRYLALTQQQADALASRRQLDDKNRAGIEH